MTAATAEPAKVHGRISGHETAVNGPYRPSAPAPARLGPLLSVCGLAGGVGVTTLAYLIAQAAARQLPDPVLVADTAARAAVSPRGPALRSHARSASLPSSSPTVRCSAPAFTAPDGTGCESSPPGPSSHRAATATRSAISSPTRARPTVSP